ncbi:hypothetical protein EXW96_26595 [Paenibacillus sp. JMULE4]|uniref:hypothetical protein n=1 Tax=Paenibacillus sp. JMULE4 TaxID=2518342 RepID=UPI0015773A3A|nr:hypothetical protein [Paenibacillus sp. JMULE4]NTZ20960.1 hypothetical protein [Paenibacillus sp. JMULE4]
MNEKVTLKCIVDDLYNHITAQSSMPIEYNHFHRNVRIAFAESHDLHESALNDSDKILISKEDEPTEKLEVLMGLGLIPRNFYYHTMIPEFKHKRIRG